MTDRYFEVTMPAQATAVCLLVHTFEAHSIPDNVLVAKFYAPTPPPAAFNVSPIDRLVFQRPNGNFIVMPKTLQNERLVKELK